MKCPRCGKRTISNVRFCKYCGKRIPRANKGAMIKLPLFSQLTQKQLRLTGAVGILIFIALLLVFFPAGGKRRQAAKPELLGEEIFIEKSKAGREMASNAVYGKVIAVNMRDDRRGTITVMSLHTGKVYTFTVGWRTSYHPRRYPSVGERIKVYYLSDKGLMEATQVKIDPAVPPFTQ